MRQPRLFGTVRGLPEAFEEFWATYPPRRPNPRARAEALFAQIVRRGLATPQELVEACRRYAKEVAELGLELRFVPHAATWLRQERWRDYLRQEASAPQGADGPEAVEPPAAFPRLEREIGRAAYRMWVAPLRIERAGDRVRVRAPSRFHADYVRLRFHDLLARELGTRDIHYIGEGGRP